MFLKSSVNLSRIRLYIASHTVRRQPQIYRALHISLYTHILNITYTSTQNNTFISLAQTHAHTHTPSHTNT